MKNLKTKKIVVCLSFAFFGGLNSFQGVKALSDSLNDLVYDNLEEFKKNETKEEEQKNLIKLNSNENLKEPTVMRKKLANFVKNVAYIYNIFINYGLFEERAIGKGTDYARRTTKAITPDELACISKAVTDIINFIINEVNKREEDIPYSSSDDTKFYNDNRGLDLILNYTFKLFEIVVCINDNDSLLKILCPNNNRNMLCSFERLPIFFKKWNAYINDIAKYKVSVYKNLNFKFLQHLKLIYNQICSCNNITDLGLCLSTINRYDYAKQILEEKLSLQKKMQQNNSVVNVSFIDWVSISTLNILKKIYGKIEQFLEKAGIKKETNQLVVRWSAYIKLLIDVLTSAEEIAKSHDFVSLEGTQVDCFKNRLDAFQNECEDIFKTLDNINSNLFLESVKPSPDIDEIETKLEKLDPVLDRLQQKASKIVCFNDYYRSYSVLNKIYNNFKFFRDISDPNGVLEKLKNLAKICEIASSGYYIWQAGCLPGMIEDLNSKLANFEENKTKPNLKYMRDIDLILSLFELIDLVAATNVATLDNSELKYEKCYAILFDENSNISKFLNYWSSKNKRFQCAYKQINSYFKESDFFKNVYGMAFTELDKPEVETSIVNYAIYNIFKFKRLRAKMFKVPEQYYFKINACFDENNSERKDIRERLEQYIYQLSEIDAVKKDGVIAEELLKTLKDVLEKEIQLESDFAKLHKLYLYSQNTSLKDSAEALQLFVKGVENVVKLMKSFSEELETLNSIYRTNPHKTYLSLICKMFDKECCFYDDEMLKICIENTKNSGAL